MPLQCSRLLRSLLFSQDFKFDKTVLMLSEWIGRDEVLFFEGLFAMRSILLHTAKIA